MQLTLSIALAILASTIVQAAPTASLDISTLLQNGKDAQKLNAQFKNGTAPTTCTDDETTCIGNAIAKCTNGKFDTSTGACANSQSCFAIPNIRTNGTALICTSEKNAQSLINASGALGSVTGDGSSGSPSSTATATASTSSPSSTGTSNGGDDDDCDNDGGNDGADDDDGDDDDCNETSSMPAPAPSTISSSGSSTAAPERVTVTVTVIATASTQTISPSQASEIISSASATMSPSPASSAVFSGGSESSFSVGSTIVLGTVGSSATAAEVPPVTSASGLIINIGTATATSGSVAPAITFAATGSSDGGYGGY